MSAREHPRHWYGLSPAQRLQALADLGEPAWRVAQIGTHVFARDEPDPHGWTDVPAGLRQTLRERWFPDVLACVGERTADRGMTVKSAWRTHDGALIESVLMRYPRRATLCLSSQAGCGMGCPFCATGQGGLRRNLDAAEIVAQVAAARLRLSGTLPGAAGTPAPPVEPSSRAAGPTGRGGDHLTNIVFMGMGEPLANAAAVLAAIRTITRPPPDGFGHSARNVTLSTVGLVPQIDALAGEELPLTLAISLHAPDDALRERLVPLNRRWGVDAVLDAGWRYADATHRRVSIEYALMRGLNDAPAQADALARQLTRRGDWTWAHVNLIPLNPTPGSPWTASDPAAMAAFQARLERAGLPVTFRDTRGSDIDGACGQLATTIRRTS